MGHKLREQQQQLRWKDRRNLEVTQVLMNHPLFTEKGIYFIVWVAIRKKKFINIQRVISEVEWKIAGDFAPFHSGSEQPSIGT